MKLRLAIACLCLTGTALFAQPKWVIDDTHETNPVLRKLGATAYRVETGAGEAPTHFQLLNKNNEPIADVTTQLLREGGREFNFRSADDAFTLVWDGKRAVLNERGAIYTLSMDPATKVVIASDGATDAFNRHMKGIVLTAETAADLHRHGALRAKAQDLPCWECPPADKTSYDMFLVDTTPGAGGGPSCFGPRVRGTATFLTDNTISRSLACEAATADANNKCTNRYCWGCCELLPCDADCLLDHDYLCVMAGVTGTSCSR